MLTACWPTQIVCPLKCTESSGPQMLTYTTSSSTPSSVEAGRNNDQSNLSHFALQMKCHYHTTLRHHFVTTGSIWQRLGNVCQHQHVSAFDHVQASFSLGSRGKVHMPFQSSGGGCFLGGHWKRVQAGISHKIGRREDNPSTKIITAKHPFVRLRLPLTPLWVLKVFLLKLQVTDSNWLAFSSPPKLCQRCRNGDPFVDLPATQRLGCMPRPRCSACFQLISYIYSSRTIYNNTHGRAGYGAAGFCQMNPFTIQF